MRLLAIIFGMGAPCWVHAVDLRFQVTHGDSDSLVPCRIHLVDEEGESYHPPTSPFWRGGFVCEGEALLTLEEGTYRYEIERGPEWKPVRGEVEIDVEDVVLKQSLSRLTDMKAKGWYGGDLHVHRDPNEMPLHLRAEDLSIASVQTWWNKTNPWAELPLPKQPVKEVDGRFYDLLSGEDERGGGALLYHRMTKPIKITEAEREWPSSRYFLRLAENWGVWAEIEKPFWWDTPVWLATGVPKSVGLAHNHMQRSGVLGNEAWGRSRDPDKYPGVHGNALYTQDLYYKILNCGFRLPPSAGSASGVLANPVGYNRVYVYAGEAFTWDTWWDGLRRGRCFVTNGPLVRLTANGFRPGELFQSTGPLEITIDGEIDSNDAIDRVEVVHNGNVSRVTLPATIKVNASSWFLVRVITSVEETFRFASTAPWYVDIGPDRMKPDADAVTFFLDWAKERRSKLEEALTHPTRRQDVLADHGEAIVIWEGLLEKAK